MSMGRTYKFFGFSISYTVITSPSLFCTYYLCFLFPVPFLPFCPLPLPTNNPPCDLHFSDSVPVLVVPLVFVLFCFVFRFYLFIFRQRGREGETERNNSVWLLPMHPLLGTWPATQACALTGNPTGDPLARSLGSVSYTHLTLPTIHVLCRSRWSPYH